MIHPRDPRYLVLAWVSACWADVWLSDEHHPINAQRAPLIEPKVLDRMTPAQAAEWACLGEALRSLDAQQYEVWTVWSRIYGHLKATPAGKELLWDLLDWRDDLYADLVWLTSPWKVPA